MREEAMRLSPLDPEMAMFLGGIAIAHYTAGRYSEAVAIRDGGVAAAAGISGGAATALREPGPSGTDR